MVLFMRGKIGRLIGRRSREAELESFLPRRMSLFLPGFFSVRRTARKQRPDSVSTKLKKQPVLAVFMSYLGCAKVR